MSQSFYEDWYDSTADPEVAFGYAEANDNAVMSNFSGTAAPGNTTQGMTWFKTSQAASTVCGLRVRNSSNNAWHKVFHGTSACRLWMYRNNADAGWIIDSSIADVVISVKASAASGYGSTGGVTGGSWTITGLVSSHRHKWLYSDSSAKTYSYPSSADAGEYIGQTTANMVKSTSVSGPYWNLVFSASSGTQRIVTTDGLFTEKSSIGSTGNGAWRPSAAIGTIQYPDLT